MFDKESNDQWATAFAPAVKGVVLDAANNLWGVEAGFSFDVRHLEAENWFNKVSLKFADPINKTSDKELRALLQQAEREGWTITTTQKALTDVFNQWIHGNTVAANFAGERLPPYRTEMIARTVSMQSYNAGTNEIYKQEGVEQQEWLATQDDRTRDTHAEANGQVVGVGEPFIVGGFEMMYPGDDSGGADVSEIVNCRCTTVPIIGDRAADENPFDEDSGVGGGMAPFDEDHEFDEEVDPYDVPFDELEPLEAGQLDEPGANEFDSSLVTPGNEPLPSPVAEPAAPAALYIAPEPGEYAKLNDWSMDAINNWKTSRAEWIQTELTDTERTGLNTYTGTSYRSINRQLRGNGDPYEENRINRTVKQMDSAFSKASIDQDITLYRGIDEDAFPKAWQQSNVEDLVGMVYTDGGFSSTSTDSKQLANWGGGGNTPYKVTILAHEGQSGIYVESISSFPGEREMLLKRGSSFQVVSASQTGNIRYLTVELLQDG